MRKNYKVESSFCSEKTMRASIRTGFNKVDDTNFRGSQSPKFEVRTYRPRNPRSEQSGPRTPIKSRVGCPGTSPGKYVVGPY